MNLDYNKRFPNQLLDGDPTECVAITIADICGNLDNTSYDSDFTYAMTLHLQGVEPTTAGSDPYYGMNSAVAYGLLPSAIDTTSAKDQGEIYVANWQNYTEEQRLEARKHRQNGIIDYGTSNLYEKIVNHLTLKKTPLSMPLIWHSSFMDTVSGVLPAPSGGTYNHNVAVYGVRDDGMLIIKPWIGQDYGDGGYGYMSKEICDQVAVGAYAFDKEAIWSVSILKIILLLLRVVIYDMLRLSTQPPR